MNLKTAFLLLWIAFLLSSCAGSGQYQTTRSHYTPNLAKEKLNAELAWVGGTGASANAALKVSEHWGAVATFQSNRTSYNASPGIFATERTYAKRGYSIDLGANFNTPIGKKGSFNVSSGVGYNTSELSAVTKGYSYVDYYATKGAYWYIQPYLTLGQHKKTKHQFTARFQNYGFNLSANNIGYSSYSTTQRNNELLASFSLGYGIDWSVMPNLNITTQIGLETPLNGIEIKGTYDTKTSVPEAGWAKIGIQFVLPSKK